MKPELLNIVTAIFNPRRFRSRGNLYRQFKKYVSDAGANLITVELAFGDRPFEVTEASDPNAIQLRSSAEIWQKERLLNLGIHRVLQLDPGAKYIAWLDADTHFTRTDWAAETVHMLQHHAVVQMFETALLLGPNGDVQYKCEGAIKHWWNDPRTRFGATPGLGAYSRAGHPGLGWAFRRDALDNLGGLLDFCIAGSGDLHMMACFTGDYRVGLEAGLSRGYVDELKNWAMRAYKHVNRNVGFVTGTAMHYWHGKSSDRGYDKRWDILKRYQFDPRTDIKPDAQGCWQWTGNKPQLAYALSRSLAARNEDSIDV